MNKKNKKIVLDVQEHHILGEDWNLAQIRLSVQAQAPDEVLLRFGATIVAVIPMTYTEPKVTLSRYKARTYDA